MEFRTIVDIPKPAFEIQPCEEVLFVGSCFADEIGQRFRDNGFPVTINPFGVMYNPASILHTIEKYEGNPHIVFLTLGTKARLWTIVRSAHIISSKKSSFPLMNV